MSVPTQPNPLPQHEAESERLLLIDPDLVVCNLLQSNLEPSFKLDMAASAEEALEMPLATYSLLLLDINLGGVLTGLQFVEMLQRNPNTALIPFIFCTDLDSEDDIERGFEAGADDYVVKPFSLRELVARVRSVIRRHSITRRANPEAARPKVFKIDGLTAYPERQMLEIDGEPVSVSRTEFLILSYLMSSPNVPHSRADLQKHVWPKGETVSDRAVDVNISRLKKKLGTYAVLISNVPGQGYMISSE